MDVRPKRVISSVARRRASAPRSSLDNSVQTDQRPARPVAVSDLLAFREAANYSRRDEPQQDDPIAADPIPGAQAVGDRAPARRSRNQSRLEPRRRRTTAASTKTITRAAVLRGSDAPDRATGRSHRASG